MKKTLLSIAFVAAGIFAFNASAQESCCNPAQACCNPTQECCGAPAKAARPAKPNPMEGITLSAEQQAAVDALNEKYAEARKEKLVEKKESQSKERMQSKDSRKEYLKELKGILTPEQYTTYLENIVTSQAPSRMAPKGKAIGNKHLRAPRKGDKKVPRKDMKKAPVAAESAPEC